MTMQASNRTSTGDHVGRDRSLPRLLPAAVASNTWGNVASRVCTQDFPKSWARGTYLDGTSVRV
jgi:hypothetical protein